MNSYTLITLLLWPALVAYTARIAWRDSDWRYFRQRLGYGYPVLDPHTLWIHCASVGEVITIIPLLDILQQQYPHTSLLVTTNTVTGAQMVRKNLPRATHCYLPIENRAAIRRFLRRLQPKLALIMETELWPLLYRQCRQAQVPLCLVNARLSPRTRNSHPWIRARYRDALARVDRVLCRSDTDRQAFIELGLDTEKAQTVGNLKFARATTSTPSPPEELETIPYVLAASTHDDEEYRLARAWQAIRHDGTLLVIAPRHPQRAEQIVEQLASLGLTMARRSLGEPVTESTDIYLADTLGEMPGLMAGAQLVFMGGSLIQRGGQNLLEPAGLGKAILVGPHMDNFEAETRLLVSEQACVQLQSPDALADTLENLLENESERRRLGARAAEVMTRQGPVARHYADIIAARYPEALSA